MKTYKEYPASHSIDTDWFAVDRDGNLGLMMASEDAPLPVTVSDGWKQDPEYDIHCLMEASTEICPGLYQMEIETESFKTFKTAVLKRKECHDYWDDCGQVIATDGRDFRELRIWNERTERMVFISLCPDFTFFMVYGTDMTDGIEDDIKSGRIAATSTMDWQFFGIPYEGNCYNTWYEYEKNPNFIRVKVKVPKKNRYEYLTYLDVSFDEKKPIRLREETYIHFGWYDPSPIKELRERFQTMSMPEREKALFEAIKYEDPEYGIQCDVRAVGILLSEFDVSPFACDRDGKTALELAKETFFVRGFQDSKYDYYFGSHWMAIIRMLEHKARDMGYPVKPLMRMENNIEDFD